MAINTNIVDNPTIIQYGSYGRIDNDTNFPAVSVYRTRYPDQTTAYNNTSATPISAYDVQVFPRYAQLTYSLGTTVTTPASGSSQSANVTVSATEGRISPGSTNITSLTGSGNFQKLWVYPIASFAAGVLTFNAGNVYVGKGGTGSQYLPDILTPSGGPLLIQLPQGQQMPISQVIIKLVNTADGVFYSWT